MTLADENGKFSHRGVALSAPKDIRVCQRPTLSAEKNQVQLEIKSVGICGSDLHYYYHAKNGTFEVKEPLVLGHEGSGQVVQVGEGVRDLKVGDRVAVEPQVPCRICNLCKSGHYNLCSQVKFTGSAQRYPHIQGMLQQFYCHEADFCHKLPDHISYEEGAMLEPLSVALQAINRSHIKAGKSVTIVGAGPIGLLCGAVAKCSGASHITMIDPQPSRVEFAKKYIADEAFIVPARTKDHKDDVQYARSISAFLSKEHGVKEAPCVFECAGVPVCTTIAINLAAPSGEVVLVGFGTPIQTIDMGYAALREVNLIGVFRYVNTYDQAIELVRTGMVDVKSLVSHRFDMEDAKSAFEMASSGSDGVIKVLINNGAPGITNGTNGNSSHTNGTNGNNRVNGVNN